MSFPKPKRVVDKKLLAKVKAMPCLVCGKGPSDPDHIVTRGAGGGDEAHNVWPLCRTHHTERHKIGLHTFIAKYQQARGWLKLHRKPLPKKVTEGAA